MEGMFIPMAILAVFGFFEVLKIPNIKKKYFASAAVFFILLVIPSNIYVFSGYFKFEFDPENYYSAPYYLSDSEFEVLQWLKQNTDNGDVVLANPKLSNYIPRLSGNKIYVGHWAQTVNYDEKLAWYNSINLDNIKKSELSQRGINYVLSHNANDDLTQVYEYEKFKVLKVG